jgi:hypothetical protein
VDNLYDIMIAIGALPAHVTRADAGGYTKNLYDQLTAVKTTTYDQRYVAFKARRLIPIANDTSPAAEKVKYYSWSEFGMSQIIAKYSDDLPLVTALRQTFEADIVPFGQAYEYTVQDVIRAAMSGESLSSRDAIACRTIFEQTVEEVAAVGNSKTGLTGLANHPNVTIYVPTTGTWSTATGIEMALDAIGFMNAIVIACKEVFMPNTLVLDITSHRLFMTTPVSTTGDSMNTAARYFLNHAGQAVTIESWNKLRTADAAGTGPRAVMYPMDRMVLEMEIPLEYTELPPQAKNLAFIVNTHGRIGGVNMYYPPAVGYMDGL